MHGVISENEHLFLVFIHSFLSFSDFSIFRWCLFSSFWEVGVKKIENTES